MFKRLKTYFSSPPSILGVVIILIAAALLEIISAAQYYYSKALLQSALEKHAETEMVFKAILTKSTLSTTEKTIYNHIWDMKRNINEPDSMFNVALWMMKSEADIIGGGIAFTPNRFPEKGRLYEPWAYEKDDSVYVGQMAGQKGHDYTQRDFYRGTVESDTCYWSDPYLDSISSGQLVTTCGLPIHDSKGEIVGVMGVDLSLKWLGDTLNARHIYPSSFVFLLTEDGKLIAEPPAEQGHTEDVRRAIKLINDSATVKHESESRRCNVIEFTSATGKEGDIFYANLRGKPHWQVVIVCFDNEVYSELKQMRFNVWIMMLLGLALLAFIVHLFMRNARQLTDTNRAKARIDSELRIAQNIQQELLPIAHNNEISRNDIDVKGLLQAAREVGGDLFDHFVRDEKLFFCIGDVSGKGVPSALLMAVVHSLFRTVAARENNPRTIMRAINIYSSEGNKSCMFVTMFIGILDLPTGRLRYCNAGHDVPFIINADGCRQLEVDANLPLGVMADCDYSAQECYLQPGDTLFLYTDGVTEARALDNSLFGLQRLEHVLAFCGNQSAQTVTDNVVKAVQQFAQGAEQSDDITMLTIAYTPQQESYRLDSELTLKNRVSEVTALGEFIKDVNDRLNIDSSTAHDIKLAVEEAVVNVIDYAYPDDVEGTINIHALADDDSLRFIITDSGAAFDPTEALKADTTLALEDRPIGGLGIFLVRQLMDAINYERIDGKNRLTLIKKIDNKHINNE